ncbi:DNA-binding transcriptional regulator [Klebsiella aerogenes]|uniref:YbeF family transcriptional regulator n=1 Tax=unclassified Klebsiella TaxID=2608929 RepID=UPI00063C2330|nr:MULTISPECIES: YbeF family transcriptional regulator [Klebsiella]EIW9479112.1 DNA-binding transcriptional regulator [Klebsiella aerogenes]EIW9499316.1 DNA-binding transcriptional regulator [Klebsiella aerogenes]EKM7512946.1 DNA-binding transcriptional regulator [Klebsiella aerogenes]EKV8806641.1 DNA-binding transcriptional regulator [Klebsiella aerogenes]EKW8936232.1 DNA-binding transcriptional regulator [Klebsiella aerogenes]
MADNHPPLENNEQPEDRQIFRILRNIDLNLLTIFEAVYVHKGIVNAAKVLNITPSAISQSINKLRALFPDPLFIRKGQGVTPTAFATHLHQYISQGMEAFLNALDLGSSSQQQRVLTIATAPTIGALVMPTIANALKARFPQVLLHNIAITDAASQLNQRQVDLLIDTYNHSGLAIAHQVLFSEPVVMFCRENHPILPLPLTRENLQQFEFALLLPEGQRYPALHRQLDEFIGERRCGFSSYNLLTQAAMMNNSDLLGLTPESMFALVAKIWPLQAMPFPPLQDQRIDFSLHYNRQSAQEPLLKEIIDTILQTYSR